MWLVWLLFNRYKLEDAFHIHFDYITIVRLRLIDNN